MTEFAIETHNLRKVYGRASSRRFTAVDDLSLQVRRGQIFGFLGPNGAGKTTSINMLLGNVSPTAGSATLLGAPVGNRAVRAKLGFLPEKFQFHEFLTAAEFLDLHGKLYGMDAARRKRRAHEALELVGLLDRRKSRLREFSKGMQQRIGLAQAILNEPEVVILDEPTSALDPLGRRSVRDLIAHLKSQGATVFLNSHLLSEIEMTCDEVAIIKAGRVIRQGRIADLIGVSSEVEMRVANVNDAIRDDLKRLTKTLSERDDVIVATVANDDIIPDLVEAVVRHGGRLHALTPRRESLEELFVRVIENEPQS